MTLILTAKDFPKDKVEMQFMLANKLKGCFYEIIKTRPNEWAVLYAKQGMDVEWNDISGLKLHAQKVLTNLKYVTSLEQLKTKQLIVQIIGELQKSLEKPHGF